MINAIDHALRNVYQNIPIEILELAFNQQGGRKSLDEEITQKVIEDRIRPDLSAIAGQYKEIILDPSWASVAEVSSDNASLISNVPYAIYCIPPKAREYRQITGVIGMQMPYGATNSLAMAASGLQGGMVRGVSAGTFANQAINGITFNDTPLMPTPILMAGNQIRITPFEMSMMRSFSWLLKCRLEYDKDFTNLTPDAVVQLSELVVTATKAFIFNALTIKLDMGYIRSGQEIGRIREIIDQYAEQVERYNVIRMEFHGSAEQLDINTLRERLLMGIF